MQCLFPRVISVRSVDGGMTLSNGRTCAIYIRVSKDEQKPQNQENALLEYAKNNNFKIYKVYIDKTSGAKQSRPALNDLMMDSRQKKFDVIIVWKLDRLGRSLQHLLQITQEWRNRGIDFICTTQQFDTTTSHGSLVFNVLAAIAEFERELISERTKEGLKTAARKGRFPGRPKGSKDSTPRKKAGYYLRYAKEKNGGV